MGDYSSCSLDVTSSGVSDYKDLSPEKNRIEKISKLKEE
jgi:hypothetical protein